MAGPFVLSDRAAKRMRLGSSKPTFQYGGAVQNGCAIQNGGAIAKPTLSSILNETAHRGFPNK